MAESITLQTSDSNVQQSDVLGRLSFAASNESNTSDARLIGGSIYAMAEGDFTEIANPTSLVFATASSESATSKLKITSEGHFVPLSSGQYDLGSILYPFRNVNTNIVSFNVDDESVLTKGQISWDDTEGTMDIGLTDNTAIHIGEHRYFRIRNETGGILYKGQVVYATGVHSNGLITPAKYVADGTVREVRFMGLVLEDVNDQNNGYVIDFGHLENMDLDGSATNYAVGDETWSAGDILYVHPTGAGKLTKNEPKHSISVAIVLDPGNGNGNGRMFVRPISYGHLDDNHDVAVSGATNGQFLQYNSVTDYWVPSSSGNFTYLTRNNAPVIISDNTGVTGADIVDNLISLTQSEYDAITPDVDTVYVITDASAIACCIDGSGIANYLAKWSDSDTLTSGIIYDNGTNVGIGTSSPSSKLHVNGNATFSASSGVPVTITNNGTGNSFQVNDGAGDTTPFVVDADGKVGIRGATPSGLHSLFNTLCVGAGGTAAQGITVFSQSVCTLAFGDTAAGDTADSARGYVAYTHTTDTLTIGTNNATRITVDSTGQVGIGTSTPSAKLNVENGNVIFNDLGGNYDFRVEGDTDPNLLFTDASTDRVGIGTASPTRQLHSAGSTALIADGSTYELDISASAATFGGNRFQLLGTETVFNQAGGNYDFRVEGDTDANLLFTDASTDRVGIGTATPTEKLDVNGSIKTRTGGVGHEDNGCYIAYPGGGTLRNGGNPQTGYLKITLPVSWTSTMLQFEFDLYEYSTGLLKKFRIAGYNFAAGSYWANVSAIVDSDNDYTKYKVHFGHDGTYCAIYISEINSSDVDLGASSTWTYPHGSISNFFGGWSNMTMDNWADGWSIGFTTTLGTITNTRESSRPYRQHDTSYVFNEYGGNVDFRVEGDTDANLFFTDASTDRVGIGTSSPSYKLDVVGTGNFSHVISSGCPAVISNTGIASGSDQILNIVSLTQAEYDAATKNSQTLYIIT